MKDKNGFEINKGDTVIVPEPDTKYADMHQHGFVGQVDAIRREFVIVIDGEGDAWTLEPERLEVQDN
jgi:hypothetical protein